MTDFDELRETAHCERAELQRRAARNHHVVSPARQAVARSSELASDGFDAAQFVIGYATGVGVSPSGMLGAALHSAMPDTPSCDTGASIDAACGVDVSF